MMWIKSKDGQNLCNAEETVLFAVEEKGEYGHRKYYLRAFTKQGETFNISILYDYAEAKEALKFLGDQLIPPRTNITSNELPCWDEHHWQEVTDKTERNEG